MSYKVVATPRLAALKKAVSSALGLCTFFVAVGVSAATVEFKLAPDLKGREYRQALNGIAELGKLSTTGRGTYSIETANDVAANSALRNLREKRSVLWASVPSLEVPAGSTPAATKDFHSRMLALQLRSDAEAGAIVSRLAGATGLSLRLKRIATGNRAMVVLPTGTTASSMAAVSVAAEKEAGVVGVSRVRMMSHQWLANDSLMSQQWSLGSGVGGIRAPQAWDITPSGSVQVAVIDTGIRSHQDLDGKRVSGYDMISQEFIASDGNGRDADESDPGDFDDDFTCSGSYSFMSSWHGTHVAGIIGATTNNGTGIAGVAPNARIQSVRALGRCGGTAEDVADSIRWAAGVPVVGVPANPMPSKILNLSLGGSGPCETVEQSAVDAAIARGAIVVVAAGNDETLASDFSPANCKGVITVAASTLLGDLASYSNFGSLVSISAPGGDGGNQPGIISTLNGGITSPAAPSYANYMGTSMAAPHVAGVVALMVARDPSLTSGQVLNRLKSATRAFPAGSECAAAPGACGAGLLDAPNSVATVSLNRGVNEVASNNDRLHVVELLNPTTGRYMLSADPAEILRMVSSGAWQRTGQIISTFSFTSAFGAGSSVAQPVCRAMIAGGGVAYSANTDECKIYQKAGSGLTPHGVVFAAALPNSNTCPTGSAPVWDLSKLDSRGYNVRNIADTTEISAMLTQGWSYGRVAFCAPN
jgi:serine protease